LFLATTNTFNNPATASLLLLSIITIAIAIAQEDVGGKVATQEMGWTHARAWLSVSMPGMSTGYKSGCWTNEGEGERRLEGNVWEDR
jgi:hypothetical protein